VLLAAAEVNLPATAPVAASNNRIGMPYFKALDLALAINFSSENPFIKLSSLATSIPLSCKTSNILEEVLRFIPAVLVPAIKPVPAPATAPIPAIGAPIAAPIPIAVGTVLPLATTNAAKELPMVSNKNSAPFSGSFLNKEKPCSLNLACASDSPNVCKS
jgi:hypothetical protein